ncbi:CidA/LrgA family protein [Undibacterium cyanobacteriorum]|uniref:CidA/LrgA family protein n=1 Tax=Undibacterium cyanobacteriorum TaxID=3073561 RepID=A0ABY9RMX4_9BURK|nr:CidA/LrgA family protein [Undibacterium sp. 20NA77.5]WMW81341.1 CidA/LrgA family protein [Undibacterium sp. 20NA77.5]
MFFCFFVLFLFQAIGEVLSRYSPVPIPGPVVGMVVLFLCLLFSPRLLQKIEKASMELLQHLSLLFVPAGVGIMVSQEQIGTAWIAIVVSMVVSTVVTMVVVAVSFQYLQNPSASDTDKNASEQDHA